MYNKVVPTISVTLGLYHNLSSLHVEHFSVDASFRETLRSLSQLEDLNLCACQIVTSEGFLSLRSFTMSGFGGKDIDGPLQIPSPDNLRALNLDSEDKASAFIIGFGPRRLEHLAHLSIQVVGDSAELFQFLAQCPRLETLEIKSFTPQSTLPIVSPITIPLLRTVTGPSKLVQLLTPTRPIGDVTILDDNGVMPGPDVIMLACMDISQSTAPLRSLALSVASPTIECLGAITSLFPGLVALSIKIKGIQEIDCDVGLYEDSGSPPTNTKHPERPSPTFCDDTAFDDLPPDEISDQEDEDVILTVKAPPRTKPDMASLCFDEIQVRDLIVSPVGDH
jgi:hypothetical protein